MTIDLSKRVNAKQVQELDEGTEVVLAGWASDVRSLGKIAFIMLRDREGVTQLTALSDFPQFDEIANITKESVVACNGVVKLGKRKDGAKEVHLTSVEVLSPSDPQLPIDFSGKIATGLDKRLDYRFLDLRNPNILAIFKVRNVINVAIREFVQSEGFIEMQTPKVISAGAEGGATLFSVDYFGKPAYLSQSQQLYKQLMLIAGFEKIFEIGPSFRAENSNTVRHQTEFTQLDFEMSFINDEDDVLKVFERMFVHVLKTVNEKCEEQLKLLGVTVDIPQLPFPRVTYQEGRQLLSEAGVEVEDGEDFGMEQEKLLAEQVKNKYNTEAYFITKYPYVIKPFYIMTDGPISRGFDFEFKGDEIFSGGQREHRHEILVNQIADKGLNPKEFEFYTDPFKYGAPPHGGFGVGIDRLTMKILGLNNIREAVLFPRDPNRVIP
jgi:aspartyl-tRNA synthetase